MLRDRCDRNLGAQPAPIQVASSRVEGRSKLGLDVSEDVHDAINLVDASFGDLRPGGVPPHLPHNEADARSETRHQTKRQRSACG